MTGARDLVIGIDAGTSVMKAVAFDRAGGEVAMASRPNVYANLPGGGCEQDMEATWADAVAVLRELVERVPDLPSRVLALGVTGQGDGTWLVDRDGRPTAPAWLWLDSRAASIVAELDAAGIRQHIYRWTGCGLNACNQSVQLLWLQRHRPEVVARTAAALHCKDWLYLALTGVRATDSSEGCFTYGDVRRRAYEPEVIDALGLTGLSRLLPELVDGGSRTHAVTAEAARVTGLPQGLPVALGYVDVLCTALGGGVYAPGGRYGLSIVGSTGMQIRLFENPDELVLPEAASGYTMPFPVPGTLARMHSNMAATLNIDWVADLARDAARLAGHPLERREMLALLDAAVLEARPGAALYHPYIHEAGERGPFLDPLARAQLTGVTRDVGIADLTRAIYEGLGMAARDCYAAIGELPDEIRVAGGATRSRAFRTILAGVLGRPLRESRRGEAGAAGVAMMAMVAIGAYPDYAACTRDWVEPLLGEQVRPDPALAALYDRLFPVYRATREAMPPLWAALAQARAAGQLSKGPA